MISFFIFSSGLSKVGFIMKAMCLEKVGTPLQMREVERPKPLDHEVLIQVHTCGVCRTDLHIIDGELPHPPLPLIPGHMIVGTIAEVGKNVHSHRKGQRVGVPWLGGTCHHCSYCLNGRENLCDHAEFTGYTRNGGYAEFCTAQADYLLEIPEQYDDLNAAPLLCAGLIGYRAFRLAGDVDSMGFYGFGSSAHILIQLAHALGKEIYVFTRPGDEKTQHFAKSLGATWAGGSDTLPPKPLDSALIFAPVGALFINALKAVKKGGRVISAGIHMSDIPSFPYSLLWEERSISSVANLTREDGQEFMKLASQIPIQVSVQAYPLEQANDAINSIRKGTAEGSCVLSIG